MHQNIEQNTFNTWTILAFHFPSDFCWSHPLSKELKLALDCGDHFPPCWQYPPNHWYLQLVLQTSVGEITVSPEIAQLYGTPERPINLSDGASRRVKIWTWKNNLDVILLVLQTRRWCGNLNVIFINSSCVVQTRRVFLQTRRVLYKLVVCFTNSSCFCQTQRVFDKLAVIGRSGVPYIEYILYDKH
jgi:hypothetical protein